MGRPGLARYTAMFLPPRRVCLRWSRVYGAAGEAPLGSDVWAAGSAPDQAGGGTPSLDSAEASAYFLNDGDANSMTDWEVCMNIRDAVLAAPTCSAGSGR